MFFQLLNSGINRPGKMLSNIEGLTAKVLNDCLRKNIEFDIVKRISFNEIPPRVEYEITPFGRRFIQILDSLEKLQAEIEKKYSKSF